MSADKEPSFTIIYSRCVHLGCPVQPNGPKFEDEAKTYKDVTLTPVKPAGFGCPCHGGAYDNEGNRTAGPPVRSLDRYAFSIVDGNLVLGDHFSVGTVDGTAADAVMTRYPVAYPGVHVDGIESGSIPCRCRERLLMAKSARQAQIEKAALYPLDWVEERSGLIGYTKWFLFRNVPRDINWMQTLGAATLTAFLVQATTGVFSRCTTSPIPTVRTRRSRTSRTRSHSDGSCAACTSGERASSSS